MVLLACVHIVKLALQTMGVLTNTNTDIQFADTNISVYPYMLSYFISLNYDEYLNL